ncbi:GNAT family N-acetyltransferase [Actinacidiphila acidipaludis]|uniref:GNAT family N-acetyltransferase n=1 Tax=Actinacidiphila acidipaludis TaxID=2873382 RepID=A0ABS7Q9K6_9ACTN|nr:GNAT family N-acetyltransferase [Streptomyces acidipaludis]MBY8879845.1 GNAT family N-acetyltransferase [Streptomyces acidipaludis]
MTTTLRPAGEERRGPDGFRARNYTVCVNSRPVGSVELSCGEAFGPAVGTIAALTIDAPDRRRGRGAVAALAGEEVLRSWGCRVVKIAVPVEAEYALRLASALCYAERSRHLRKELGAERELPPGSSVRALGAAGYEPWLDRVRRDAADSVTGLGFSREAAEAWARDGARLLPYDAAGTVPEGVALLGVTHGGEDVAAMWLRTAEPAWVYAVEVAEEHRGRGHGRTAMLAAENAAGVAGARTIGLNVFTGNAPAEALYASLGYRTVVRHFTKPLV